MFNKRKLDMTDKQLSILFLISAPLNTACAGYHTDVTCITTRLHSRHIDNFRTRVRGIRTALLANVGCHRTSRGLRETNRLCSERRAGFCKWVPTVPGHYFRCVGILSRNLDRDRVVWLTGIAITGAWRMVGLRH